MRTRRSILRDVVDWRWTGAMRRRGFPSAIWLWISVLRMEWPNDSWIDSTALYAPRFNLKPRPSIDAAGANESVSQRAC